MLQFSDNLDTLTIEFHPVKNGCEMTFKQVIGVLHEEGWSEEDIKKVEKEYPDGSEYS